MHIYTPALVRSVVVASCLALAGCQGIRMVTYPKDFTWLEDQEVTNVMHNMASSMYALDDLMMTNSAVAGTQYQMLKELEKIEFAALSLTPKAAAGSDTTSRLPATNHLLIDEHIDEFLTEVTRAKLQVQAEPPNYYVVGRLTGGCNACHRQR